MYNITFAPPFETIRTPYYYFHKFTSWLVKKLTKKYVIEKNLPFTYTSFTLDTKALANVIHGNAAAIYRIYKKRPAKIYIGKDILPLIQELTTPSQFNFPIECEVNGIKKIFGLDIIFIPYMTGMIVLPEDDDIPNGGSFIGKMPPLLRFSN